MDHKSGLTKYPRTTWALRTAPYTFSIISLKVSVMEFIEDEILKKREREKLQRERMERLEDAAQVKVKTDR